MAENLLCYGDNANFLRDKDLFPDGSVDLIYLDPPFNSKRPYNILFKDHKGTPSEAQIRAFDDTWKWDERAQSNYDFMISGQASAAESLIKLMGTFNDFLGHSEMFAYLVQMATRLVMMRRVLKKTGSLYLHCDPTASHYLKLVLDAILGATNFRNEIVWRRTGSHNSTRRLGAIHDTILYYAKSQDYTFNIVRRPYMKQHVERRYKAGPDGRLRFSSGGNVLTGAGTTDGDSCAPWRGFDPAAKNRHWAIPSYYESLMPPAYRDMKPAEKLEALYQAGLVEIEPGNAWPIMVRYLDERDGVPLQDIWAYQPYTEGTVHGTNKGIDADVAWMGPTDPERLGYQTQKPNGLLERIIATSSNPGGVVLDPFCGCGTTIDAVETLNREHPDEPPRTWIGIDITHLAINLIKNRLARFEPPPTYRVVGEPEDLGGARDLATRDRYQFEYWALGLVVARPAKDERKKGADKGIDGSFHFTDDAKGTMKTVLIQVKSGHVGRAQIGDFRGVLEREKAEMGVFITLEKPTKPMIEEAVSAGHYHSEGYGRDYPRIQILTIEELLADPDRLHPRCLRTPPRVLGETFKQAPKHKKKGPKQLGLPNNRRTEEKRKR